MDQNAEEYYARTIAILEDAYVAADEYGDLPGGSGSHGGGERWERKRRIIAHAFDHDGTWIDLGCANGYLMETLHGWIAEKGVHVEPYGLDLCDRVAERARLRLKQWAARIWVGNVMTWNPPQRFDYATLLPDLVPPELLHTMIVRVRDNFLNSRGRLIVNCYRPAPAPGEHQGDGPSAPALLHDLGFEADGSAEVRDDDGTRWTSVAWIDRK